MATFGVNALKRGSQQQLWINDLLEASFDGRFIDPI